MIYQNKILSIVVFLFLIFTKTNAQNENNIWLLNRNVKIDFNTIPPVVSEQSNNLGGNESCIVVSDEDTGGLLFYSDGYRVWNKNHELLQNSSNIFENFTSTLQGVAVVKSKMKNIYYLYSLESAEFDGRLYISEIDMGLNAGNGKVTRSKIIEEDLTEQLLVVSHPCKGVWVITHKRQGDSFRVKHMYNWEEISTVESNIGINRFNNNIGDVYFVGTFSLSMDNILISSSWHGIIESFRFNPFTGKISEPILIANSNSNRYLNGVFANNSSLFYTSTGDLKSSWIEQYDFSTYEINAIKNSLVKVGTIPNQILNPLSKFTYGKDNKIYYTSRNTNKFLMVINEPNKKGLECNVGTFPMPPDVFISNVGLPNPLVFSTEKTLNFLPPDTSFCTQPSLTLSSSHTAYDSIRWSTGAADPTISVADYGNYSATIYKNGCEYHDTMTILRTSVPSSEPLVRDTAICQGQQVRVNIPLSSGEIIRWNDGSMTNDRTLTSAGVYWVEKTYTNGCTQRDTMLLTVSQNSILIQQTVSICAASSYGYKGKTYTVGQTITDTLKNTMGLCDTILRISVQAMPQFIVYRDTNTCANTPLSLFGRVDIARRYCPSDLNIHYRV